MQAQHPIGKISPPSLKFGGMRITQPLRHCSTCGSKLQSQKYFPHALGPTYHHAQTPNPPHANHHSVHHAHHQWSAWHVSPILNAASAHCPSHLLFSKPDAL